MTGIVIVFLLTSFLAILAFAMSNAGSAYAQQGQAPPFQSGQTSAPQAPPFQSGQTSAPQAPPFQSGQTSAPQAPPFQSGQTSASDAYILGQAVGNALGVRDGSARGISDDIAGLDFNSANYFRPQPAAVCEIYQEFYDFSTCPRSIEYSDFSNGYYAGHESGYLYGYIAGYYLETTLGSLLQSTGESGGAV